MTDEERRKILKRNANRRYIARHREQVAAKAKAYYQAHREKYNQYGKDYYQKLKADKEKYEKYLFDKRNKYRVKCGLKPLEWKGT